MFQSHQAVQVIDSGLDSFGGAGTVVGTEEGKVLVRLDSDNEVYSFELNQLKGL